MVVQETKTWRYAIGMFGTSIPINMLVAFMAFYYTDVLSVLTAPQIAAVLLAYAIIDALDNPLYGYLSDRTRTRWGRRRPWLLLGAPALGIGLILFYSPPDTLGPAGYLTWFAVFAILTQTADSLVNTNYGSLLPELFPHEARRARVNALRQGFGLAAIVLSVAVTPMLAGSIGYSATAMIYAPIAVVAIFVMATGAHEDPDRLVTPQPRLVESVRAIFGTPSFWAIAITNGLYAGAIALLLAGTPFFVQYTLGLDAANATVLLATVILTSAAFLALWARLVRLRGAVRVWRFALALLAVAFVPMYFATNLLTATVAGLFIGLGYSGVIATVDLVVARFIDADAARNGRHREAMVIAAFGFFNRLNALLKSLGLLLMFVIYGFANADDPGERPGDAARFLMLVMPCVLVAIAAVLSRFVRVGPAGGDVDAGRLAETGGAAAVAADAERPGA